MFTTQGGNMADAARDLGSPEAIALKLLLEVAKAEGKDTYTGPGGDTLADRKWILDTYAECLLTVTQPHTRGAKPKGF